MEKTPDQMREDEVLLRMLNTPPRPRTEAKLKGDTIPKAPESSD
jgi:hypothetical protein